MSRSLRQFIFKNALILGSYMKLPTRSVDHPGRGLLERDIPVESVALQVRENICFWFWVELCSFVYALHSLFWWCHVLLHTERDVEIFDMCWQLGEVAAYVTSPLSITSDQITSTHSWWGRVAACWTNIDFPPPNFNLDCYLFSSEYIGLQKPQFQRH